MDPTARERTTPDRDGFAWLALATGVPGAALCLWLGIKLGPGGALFATLAPIGFLGAVLPSWLPRSRLLAGFGLAGACTAFLTALGFLVMLSAAR